MKFFWSEKPLITKKAVLLHPLNPQGGRNDDSVAQQVEHNTFNVGVLGSSPSRVTEKVATGCDFFLLYMFLFLVKSNQLLYTLEGSVIQIYPYTVVTTLHLPSHH